MASAPMLPRRAFCAMLLAAVAAGSAAPAAAADEWPTKPIRFIVPFPPGGPTDVMGRVVAKAVGDALHQQVIVENKPGAGGNLGTDAIAKAAPDGTTFGLAAISSLAIAPGLYAKLPFDPVRDLTRISGIGITKGAIVAHPSAPFNDLKGLVAYAKANPNKLSFASSGVGTANHLAGELLMDQAGIQMTHVPYKGTSQSTQDLLAGVVPLSVESSLSSAAPNVKAGKVKAIAITAAQRSPLLPDVPTVAEQGFPGFDVPTWFALVAPAGLDRGIVQRMHQAITAALASAEVRERFAQIGAEPWPTTPAALEAFQKAEIARWTAIIRKADIKPE